jgi:hypothetical protein
MTNKLNNNKTQERTRHSESSEREREEDKFRRNNNSLLNVYRHCRSRGMTDREKERIMASYTFLLWQINQEL